MKYNEGIYFSMSTAAIKGRYVDESGNFYDTSYKITKAVEDDTSNVAFGVECADGYHTFQFPCVTFLDKRNNIKWNSIPNDLWNKWKHEIASDVRYTNSMNRAKYFMEEYIRVCGCLKEHIIVMLDGDGSNRMACILKLEEARVPKEKWPQIITFEMDPEVALPSKMLFESQCDYDCIIFTGSDSTFNSKSLPGNGCLLEHLITKRNDLYTDDMKKRTKAIYFDYCGGPPLNQNPQKCRDNFDKNVLPKLPNNAVLMVTMSYRQHPFLQQEGINGYISCPSMFELRRSFTVSSLSMSITCSQTNIR
jgi:hypothetical protein